MTEESRLDSGTSGDVARMYLRWLKSYKSTDAGLLYCVVVTGINCISVYRASGCSGNEMARVTSEFGCFACLIISLLVCLVVDVIVLVSEHGVVHFGSGVMQTMRAGARDFCPAPSTYF